MEAMPYSWQQRFVSLADEMYDRFDWEPNGVTFNVQGKRDGKFTRLPPELCNYRHPDRRWLDSIDRTKRNGASQYV